MPVERRVGTLLLRLAGAFLLAVAVVAVVAPRPPNITYARLPVLVCLVLGAVVVLLAGRLVRRVPDRRALDVVGVAVTLLGSAVSTVLAFALRYDFGWDARVVAGMAQRLASSVGISARTSTATCPGTRTTCRCWWWTTSAGTVGGILHLAPATVFVLLNGVGLAVTLQATYWLVAMLRGRVYGVVAELVVLVLVGLSPWMSVSYTDLVAMPCVVLATALVVAVPRTTVPIPTGGAPRGGCRPAARRVRGEDDARGQPRRRRPRRGAGRGLPARRTSSGRHRPGRRSAAVPGWHRRGPGRLARRGWGVGRPHRPVRGRPRRSGGSTWPPPSTPWTGSMRYGGYDTDIVRATRQLDREPRRGTPGRAGATLADLGSAGYATFLGQQGRVELGRRDVLGVGRGGRRQRAARWSTGG